MDDELMARASERLGMPLCRRYVLACFETLRVPIQKDSNLSHHTLYWALGVLPDGQYELLGAWPESLPGKSMWDAVLEDLAARGVERIQFVSGSESTVRQSVLRTTYSAAVAIPSTASSSSGRAKALQRRLRMAVDAMRQLQGHAKQTVLRCGSFSNSAQATTFVMAALSLAEQKRIFAEANVKRISRHFSYPSRKPSGVSRKASL